jgi:alkanesulfonate monooxygenase SsuD/methylene tetrahydromethanopterin reductase-like flavin-dependent oxidoreductase (luciferase family)
VRYAIDVAPIGDLADPATIAELAAAAESAGWDGISTWDSLGTSIGAEAADPFVVLTAAAARTDRLRLITSVLAVTRRRPQLVAQSAATLDRWSGGRLILGVGSGGDAGDFEPFGESFETRSRALLLDESVTVIDRLLRGETVEHEGPRLRVRDAAVGPRPIQVPRPPIWIGGMKPGALRRAAAWDGWIAVALSGETFVMERSADEIGAMIGECRESRRTLGRETAPFDVAVFGVSDQGAADAVAGYAAAGATWWLESLSPMRGSVDDLLALVRTGPPVADRLDADPPGGDAASGRSRSGILRQEDVSDTMRQRPWRA